MHLKVPVHKGPTEVLIEKPRATLEVAARHCIATRESVVRTGNPVLQLLALTVLFVYGAASIDGLMMPICGT